MDTKLDPSEKSLDAANSYPLVRLDVDVITDSIAGRLATSLLGHVLFLKNQIPFPVMRLERIPRGQDTNTRVDKQCVELLASFDTISSHMDTTFSALSTALARCSNYKESKIARAYLAILVGPSLVSAKSKVLLGIDGLEKRIWGNHTYSQEKKEALAGTEDEDSGDDDESEEELTEDEDDKVSSSPRPPPPPTPSQHSSYASEQRFLQNAERLLARTLAAADADGRGIISEMSPTQTHVLIRAPRLFSHPAWIPRQNLSTSLNSMLSDFLDHSGINLSTPLSQTRQNCKKKNHVEGVWITSRAGIQKEIETLAHDNEDMIWWSWEGKLAGFSDWP